MTLEIKTGHGSYPVYIERGALRRAAELADAEGRVFIVTDSGRPFDPTAAPEADITLAAEDRPIGGLGILLVRNIMDSVRYDRIDGKNVLTMSKNLL